MILLRYDGRKIDGLDFRVKVDSVEKLERSPSYRLKCDKELQIFTAGKFSKIVLRGRSQKCRPVMLEDLLTFRTEILNSFCWFFLVEMKTPKGNIEIN